MKILLLSVVFVLFGCGAGSEVLDEKYTEDKVRSIEMVSHRGIGAGDNTIEGFENALNYGFHSVEADLRMQGGKVVLSHDKTVDGIAYASLDDLIYFASSNGIKVWIESKEYEVIVPTINAINETGVKYNFSSFEQSHIDLIESIDSNIETGLIISKSENIESANADWLILNKNIIKDNQDKLYGKKVAAWTIKSQGELDSLRGLVDAAISDVDLH